MNRKFCFVVITLCTLLIVILLVRDSLKNVKNVKKNVKSLKNVENIDKNMEPQEFTNQALKIQKHPFGNYEIWEIDNLLTNSECEELIRYATSKGLEESSVWNHTAQGNEKETDHRRSHQTWLKNEEHEVAAKLSRISEEITGVPMENQEQLQVARYDIHGMFNDHYDACDSVLNPENCEKMNRGCGQRRTTLLVYLNDDFEGGETEFVLVPFKCKPKTGKAILFWNVDEHDILIKEAKHRGNQVLKGNKWIANKWSHSKPWIE